MKNKLILGLLFVLPIATYLIFASAKHNSLFLPILFEYQQDLPQNWQTSSGESVQLENKITILGFTGFDIAKNKGNLFNLNQKIYNKYAGFTDFQVVMVAPKGTESDIAAIFEKFKTVSEDLSGWKVVFADPEEIKTYFETLQLIGNLGEDYGTPSVVIIDKNINLRGRKGKNKLGEDEYKDSYNTISAAELHNDMTDDVKILLREYRLALKKNEARKDDFRDKIKENIEKNK
jgi:hypothetical protein